MSNILEVPNQHAIQSLIAKGWSARRIARNPGPQPPHRHDIAAQMSNLFYKVNCQIHSGSLYWDGLKRTCRVEIMDASLYQNPTLTIDNY